MLDPDRRPTAQEIEELIDLVRRDPGSPAFIDLGEAYLALGRPRDAVQVGNLGLETSPDNLEGRLLLARAYIAMHQWKEAQGELLRVVKVDRSSRQGFAMLGEVLLRRMDFERAVPVLQHAQNLDPTSPAILSLLRRARASQPLDPPPLIPQPIPPRGETANPNEIQRSHQAPATVPAHPQAMQPTVPEMKPPRVHAAMQPTMVPQQHVPVAAPAMPTIVAQPIGSAPPREVMRPAVAVAMPASDPPSVSKSRGPKQSAPPPLSVEGIRPRIVSGQKQPNAAAASLRKSAAVGETYLNELLTGGLLDVAGVRVADAEFDLRPDRRWGRSTRRAFVFLFVVLVLGIGGGGTWYWWTEKQKGETVARLHKEATRAIGHGEFGSYDLTDPDSHGFETAIGKLNEALQADKSNLETFAYIVEVTGLEALLYGTDTERVNQAIKAIGKDIGPGDAGARELAIGKSALELARLYALDPQQATAALDEVKKQLAALVEKQPNDKWAIWLQGRAQLASGERKDAAAKFGKASEGDDGLVLAMIDRANLLVDDGKLDDALALFKKVSEKSKNHPLLILGRSLGKAEATDDQEILSELNDKFNDAKIPPKSAAYRALALALANIGADDFVTAIKELTKATAAATPPGEPRFWARVAWAHFLLGDMASAAQARSKVVWFNKKAESDPTVQLVDAALLVASGLPEKALDLAGKLEGARPRVVRIYANLDLGKYKDALGEANEWMEVAPQNIEAQILHWQAKMMGASTDDERTKAADELERNARKTNGKLGRHALGVAWLAAGNLAAAKSALEAAITDVTDAAPNALAYRTLTALAEVALAEKDLGLAGTYLDWALSSDPSVRKEIVLSNKTSIKALDGQKRTPYADHLKANSGFLPTRAMQAKVVLRNQESERALELLQKILSEGAATPAVKLIHAEALIVSKKPNKKEAREILESLRTATVPPRDFARVVALLDPKLVKEWGLVDPEEPEPEKEPKKAPPPPRRGR